MSARIITPPFSNSTFLSELSRLFTTHSEPLLTIPKLAIGTYPYFELKSYLYSLYQLLTEENNLKVSQVMVENFFRGRDTIISINKLADEPGFNLRISSSKAGIESWHRNNWCLNSDKIAYVVLNPLDLKPFTMAIERLIEKVD